MLVALCFVMLLSRACVCVSACESDCMFVYMFCTSVRMYEWRREQRYVFCKSGIIIVPIHPT